MTTYCISAIIIGFLDLCYTSLEGCTVLCMQYWWIIIEIITYFDFRSSRTSHKLLMKLTSSNDSTIIELITSKSLRVWTCIRIKWECLVYFLTLMLLMLLLESWERHITTWTPCCHYVIIRIHWGLHLLLLLHVYLLDFLDFFLCHSSNLLQFDFQPRNFLISLLE